MTTLPSLVRRIIHGIGVVFALIGATALIFYATVYSDYANIAASWIYGIGLVLVMGCSFTYNMWPRSRFKSYLRRLDRQRGRGADRWR